MPTLSGDTRLNQVLDSVPGALDYIVSLDPHDFQRLRHAALRRYMAPRITLRRVAAIARIPEQLLLERLSDLAEGAPLSAIQARPAEHSPGRADRPPEAAPAWLRAVDPAAIPWVDVVPIDDVSGDPFPPISLAVKQLRPGGVLGIRHRWEPQPLYDIWSKMDLEWFAQRVGEREWYVFVHRPSSVSAFATKPVVGAELRQTPEAEVLPRLVALAAQLAPEQTLEATGIPAERVGAVSAALKRDLGPGYRVETAAHEGQAPKVRVTAPARGSS